MTNTTHTFNGATLNLKQIHALRTALDSRHGFIVAPKVTAQALVRRDLVEQLGLGHGSYRITDAGRAWLAAYAAWQLQEAADAFYVVATHEDGAISNYESEQYTSALRLFRDRLELSFPDLADRSYELAHLWAGDFGTESVAEAAQALREKVADEKAMIAELAETKEENMTEDPRNPVVVHYTGSDGRTVCGIPLTLVERDSFHRAVDFGGDEDATHAECIAYAQQVIEDAAAEHRTHQAEIDAESGPRAYEPSSIVLGLIAFYRTQMQRLHATAGAQTKSGFLRAVREAARIEARTQDLVMTDGELSAWVREKLS